jgi:hypothetical protein
MDDKTIDGKKIIFESVWRNIALAAISWTFTIIALTLYDKHLEPFKFWGTLGLFGTGALWTTYRLLSPKYKFLRPGSKEFKDYTDTQFQIEYNDLGIFTYSDTGFTLEFDECVKSFQWDNIKTLLGYKVDNFTYDIIALQVILSDNFKFRVTEETKGWHQFLIRLKEKITEFPKDWEINISTPAFEKKLTVIYDKQKRDIDEIIKQEYDPELDDPDKNTAANIVFMKKWSNVSN